MSSIFRGSDNFDTAVGVDGPTIARCWASWNGTYTAALIDDVGISSLTDNGSGDFSFGFTNSFANSGYTVGGWFTFTSLNNYSYMVKPRQVSDIGTSSVRVLTVYAGQSYGKGDYSYNNFVCHGDLA